MSPGAEVTCLGATDLGAEVPDRAQNKILRVRYLGAIIYGADLSATNSGAEHGRLRCFSVALSQESRKRER